MFISKVRAHTGDTGNERADELASQGRKLPMAVAAPESDSEESLNLR